MHSDLRQASHRGVGGRMKNHDRHVNGSVTSKIDDGWTLANRDLCRHQTSPIRLNANTPTRSGTRNAWDPGKYNNAGPATWATANHSGNPHRDGCCFVLSGTVAVNCPDSGSNVGIAELLGVTSQIPSPVNPNTWGHPASGPSSRIRVERSSGARGEG